MLEQVAHKLAEGRININYVYGSSAGDAPFLLILNAEDGAEAARILGTADLCEVTPA